MKRLAYLLIATTLGAAHAQSAEEILKKIDSNQKTIKDVSFRISGSAEFEDTQQKIDLSIKSIPSQTLARLQFTAPDSIADNVVIADKTEIRNYMFLTNQITVMPLGKAASDAGINGLDLNQLSDISAMLKRYDVKLVNTTGAAGNRTFQLEATTKNEPSSDKSIIWITELGWRPNRIQFINKSGKTVADVTISNYKTNTGLKAEALRVLPKTAKIIKN